jgi:phosphoribosylaminoimidazole (AIR) synthetase
MPDIRGITEEKIFQTFGRGIPMCTILNEADANTIKSMLSTEQAIKQIPAKETEQIRGLEIVHDRQRLNLAEIRYIRKSLGCK